MIASLTDKIIKDVNDVANLQHIPETLLRRARGMVFAAMVYEVVKQCEPEIVIVPFLNRLTGTNMQGFFCCCKWQAAFLCETSCLMHMRTQHDRSLHHIMM